LLAPLHPNGKRNCCQRHLRSCCHLSFKVALCSS
jgi:hypothetical protein